MALKESKLGINSLAAGTLVLGIATGVLSVVAYDYFTGQQAAEQTVPPPTVRRAAPRLGVAALGRIQPQGEVIHLSFPNTLDGTRIGQIAVADGDYVKAGQVIAVLNTRARREAAVTQALKEVQVARARLAQVRAGAKRGDLQAQRATITRLQAELQNAQLEYGRAQALQSQGAISNSARDSKLLVVDTLQEQIKQAKASLGSIAEVRPVDVALAEAELAAAEAAARVAREELELTYVRAPRTAQVLKIYARAGEVPSNRGIADLGDTQSMYVFAEVYETDIEKVRIGQAATISAAALAGKLRGQVAEVGRLVNRQSIFEVNPLSDSDNKVVEVKIRLDPASSRRVAGLTNMQVQVVINL